MGIPAVGAIVVVDFPFANLRTYKKRPAVVVATSSLETVVLCQITSRRLPAAPSIRIAKTDFSDGGLQFISFVRPDKLFTVDANLAGQVQLGQLSAAKLGEIRHQIQKLFA